MRRSNRTTEGPPTLNLKSWQYPSQPADSVETELRIFAGLRVVHSHRVLLLSPQLGRTHARFTQNDDSTRVPLPGGSL